MSDDPLRLQHALEALGELGPALTANSDFRETTGKILTMVMKIAGSRSAVLFQFGEKPLMLRSLASSGFSKFSEDATVPLLPRHGYALGKLREPVRLDGEMREQFFSTDGNFNPSWLEWIVPLRIGRKLVGIFGLGEHLDGAEYDAGGSAFPAGGVDTTVPSPFTTTACRKRWQHGFLKISDC